MSKFDQFMHRSSIHSKHYCIVYFYLRSVVCHCYFYASSFLDSFVVIDFEVIMLCEVCSPDDETLFTRQFKELHSQLANSQFAFMCLYCGSKSVICLEF